MFKYVKITNSYMLKSLPYLFLGALIPAILMGFMGNPVSHLLFFYDYPKIIVNSMPGGFGTVVYAMFGRAYNIWMVSARFFLVLISFSVVIGMVDRHLRSGRFGFRNPLQRINDSLLALLPVIVALFLIQLLFSAIASGVVTLTHYIFSSFGNQPTALSTIIAAILIIALQLFVVVLYSLLLLIAPTYIMVGYPFRYSASYAARLRHKDAFPIFFACLWPFIVMTVLGYLFKLLDTLFLPQSLYVVLSILFYAYVFLYFSALAMTAYYELSGTERLDYKRSFGKKGRY